MFLPSLDSRQAAARSCCTPVLVGDLSPLAACLLVGSDQGSVGVDLAQHPRRIMRGDVLGVGFLQAAGPQGAALGPNRPAFFLVARRPRGPRAVDLRRSEERRAGK